MLGVLAGCIAADPPDRPDRTTHLPTDSTPSLRADVLDATCDLSPDNALVATCRLTLSEAAPAEIEITDGREVAVFSTALARVDPEIPIWGLHGESAWTFVARAGGAEVTGEITPGLLPEALQVEVARTGDGPHTLTHVLMPLGCRAQDYAAILDAEGRVRWYAPSGAYSVDLVSFSDAHTVLMIGDRRLLVEVDLAGRELLRKEDFELPVHHDVFRRGDRIYTLLADARPAENGETYVEDIVVALDPQGHEVWRWDERDWLDPTLANGPFLSYWSGRYPDALDAWHTNGIYVTEEGDLLVSLEREGTVLRVSGQDGSIQWVLAGDGVGNVLPATFEIAPGADFSGQHHPAMLPDGHVTLFDNDGRRAIELAIDPGEGLATLVGEWPVDRPCPFQSSLFPLPGGGRLVTCATGHSYTEFDPLGREVGRYAVTCANGARLPRTSRGQPLDLWDATKVGEVTANRVR